MKSLRILAAVLALLPAQAMAQAVPLTLPNVTNPSGQPIPLAPGVTININAAVGDGSGTVATAGASQQVLAANPLRGLLICQNPIAATEPLFVNLGLAASATGSSIELAPGGSLVVFGPATPTAFVTVTAATAGHRFICKQG